ncbi:chloride channel clic-like protein 1 [Plakobranchus ocellatus]|uniref:Chloride channel CLIC-like protein 1 n=1 Tax=Plakobranchus ocellatus TaxID=259542 RepID=A0AAV4A2D8_9GAST|nr:chloride channel clic-like protein 1 [Plakobranchus ocellatus]
MGTDSNWNSSLDESHTSDLSFETGKDSLKYNVMPRICSVTPYNTPPKTSRLLKNQVTWTMGWAFFFLVMATAVSIPWEFYRLYHKAVAARASTILQGLPEECDGQSKTLLSSLWSFFQAQFSWRHESDLCFQYHYALFVDPIWELTPLMVLSSMLSRCILHPLELISSTMGKSLRAFFSEIPLQWQPVLMLVAVMIAILLILTLTRYRLVIPLLLRIEPKTPATTPDIHGPYSHPKRNESRILYRDHDFHLQKRLYDINPKNNSDNSYNIHCVRNSATERSLSLFDLKDREFPIKAKNNSKEEKIIFTAIKDVCNERDLDRKHSGIPHRELQGQSQLTKSKLTRSSNFDNLGRKTLNNDPLTGKNSIENAVRNFRRSKKKDEKMTCKSSSLSERLKTSKDEKENIWNIPSRASKLNKRKGIAAKKKEKDKDMLWSPYVEVISDSE